MKQLHPGVKWMWRVGYVIFVLILSGFFTTWFLAAGIASSPVSSYFIALVILIILFETYIQFAYKFWKYELVHNELKIEKGVIWKVYKSIPYTRVQNVEIRRGVIARILGFSTLDVQTAGYSAGPQGRGMAEGSIPAVSIKEAEEMREYLMKRIGKSGM